jgi:hypothetical protein
MGVCQKKMYVPDINTCKIFSCGIIAKSSSMYDGRWSEGLMAHSTWWGAFKYKGQKKDFDILTNIYNLKNGYPTMVVQAQLQSQCTFLNWMIN